MKHTQILGLALVLILLATPAQAVKLSANGAGQVLLFPILVADNSNETSITIRNQDREFGKALRLVVKDPVNGRPTLAINIYLKPGDRWTGVFTDPSHSNPRKSVGHLLPWSDESCTFPRLTDLPEAGLPFSDSELTENFDSAQLINRLSTGSVEVYEMGRISVEMSADCALINRRWTASFGAWNQGEAEFGPRNRGVLPPTGGISGFAVWVNKQSGVSYHYAATVLDEFRQTALHTHPGYARSPSLLDVSPAVSKIRVSATTSQGLEVITEQLTNWSASPIHAIDALFMTDSLRAEYESRTEFYRPIAVVAMPTFAYHNDVDGYYLSDPAQRVVAPFSESSNLGLGPELIGEPVLAEALNALGETHALEPAGDAASCDHYNTAITPIALTNIVNFSHRCHAGQAELKIWARSTEAELSLLFSGQLTSDEGVVFSGLPVHGVLFQSVSDQPADPGVYHSWGWSKPMQNGSDWSW